MSNIIELRDFHAPELDVYARMTENQLLNRAEPQKGLFIAESPKVVERALDAGYVPVSLLVETKHLEGEAKDIMADFTFYDNTKKTLNKAAALKVWMEGGKQTFDNVTTYFDAAGRHPQTGERLISVTVMSCTAFESRVSEMWNYDVLVYGTWDANGRVSACIQSSNYRNENYPSPNTVKEIGKYMDNGFGVIAGHDTI